MPSALVSPHWLKEHLQDANIRIVDASWYMPAEKRDCRAEYEAAHITGAVFFDIDAIADHSTDLPHMLPTPEDFAAAVSALGIGDRHHVIVYDTKGIFSAPRVWWSFRVFGHTDVSVLEGGLPAWKAAGGETSGEAVRPTPASFTSKFRPELVKSKAQVAQAVEQGGATIIDARAPARFNGEAPEPRAGLRSGHIPGSHNLPWQEILDARQEILRTPPELEQLYRVAGVENKHPVIASCGSGLSACILALGLHETGRPDVAVYDGSWSEWGRESA